MNWNEYTFWNKGLLPT